MKKKTLSILLLTCTLTAAVTGCSSKKAEAGESQVVVNASEANTVKAEETEKAEETVKAEEPEITEDTVDTDKIDEEKTEDIKIAEDTEQIEETETPLSAAPEEKSISEPISEEKMEEFFDKVITETGSAYEDILCCSLNDFDGNGTYEGLVYVGKGPDDELGWCDGKVYFVNDDICREVYSGTLAMNDDGNVFWVMDAGNRYFVAFDEAYVTAQLTYVYYIDGDQLVESNISKLGDLYPGADIENIAMTYSAYDGYLNYVEGDESSYMWTGHTWKPYYFYYDSEKKDFMEYGGTDITEEELEKIVGFDLAGKIKGSGYRVDRILRRKNGIVNVNYSSEEQLMDGTTDITYKNANFDEKTGEFVDAWGTGGTTWQDSDFGGIYNDAMLSDIAVY
jgi:hypothetical protein